MRVKPHRHGGYIGTNSKGRFVAGTKSGSWLGAWLAIIIVPLVGFGVAAPGMLGSLISIGAPIAVMAGAGLASIWGLVSLWSSALWGWLKIALTALIGWVVWELAFGVLEIGVDYMPTLSEFKEMWP